MADLVQPPAQVSTVDPYARLAALGIELFKPRPPVANFVSAVREGDLLYLAGQGPILPNGEERSG